MNRKSPANSSQKPMKGQFPGAGRLRSAYPSLFEVLQITLAVFVLQAQAFADSPAPPRDYRTVTENQKYVFVMLAPAGWSQQDSGIRKTYTQSGLYKNDGSTTPFWTVDWYANLVFPASDGEYLIRMGPWAKGYPEEAGAMILVDTGPCVALFDRKDAEHERCRELLRAIREPLYTTVSVLTEAFHMLSPGSWGSDRLRDFISQGGLSVFFFNSASLKRAFELMEKYADHPMDLVDASLIVAAEELRTFKVFTVDRDDFATYRIRRGHRYYGVDVIS